MPEATRTTLLADLRADLVANRGYPKSVVVLVGFRVASHLGRRRDPLGRLAYLVSATVYKLGAEWVLGIELPPSTPVGPGLRLRHGVGTVVNPAARLGANVLLRHNVTIGNRRDATDCPTIGDGVELGVGAVVIGSITVGDGARIGANAVVSADVPTGAVVAAPRAVVLDR